MWATLVFCGTAGLFLVWTLSILWHLRWMRRMPEADSLPTPPENIRCSVVIAARNEESRIEETVRHLIAQRGVTLDLIVVDDRSTDRTSEILGRIATGNSRMQVRRIDTLPDGWLGKCHACHIGANLAGGEWILFTDADCWLKPDVISRAICVAEREGADHLTMTAGCATDSVGLMSSQLMFLVSLVNWFSGVNRDRPRAFVGFGAFNLVRAAAYRQCGGYEALRLTVLDDVKFGLLLRRAGKRTRAFLGADDVQCHWGARAWDMVKVLEKNYFAAIDYRTEVVIAGGTFAITVLSVALLGAASGTVAGWAAALSPFSIILPARILGRRTGVGWPAACLAPLMLPLFLYAALNSAFVTLRHGGIRWRETFYPLETLRAADVRQNR